MRFLLVCTLVAFEGALGSAPKARFAVDGVVRTPAVAVATIQPRTGAAGYSWLRVYFYSSPLGADDRAAAMKGRAGFIKAPWSAVLQLTVGKDSTVYQVDLALPGHTCTIAESDRDAKQVLQEVQFDGARLRLSGRGSHVCDMKSLGIPNQQFEWDVDVDIPVIESPR